MKKDDLYLLAGRLSKEEKSYISKKLSAFRENSMLKALFEDVCMLYTQPKNETDLILSEKYGRHFRTRKKQLYYTMLKILRNYHHTLIHQIHFYILDINLLFEKGLFEQARKILNKAKKLAEHNQIIPLYMELLYMELRMSYYTYYDNLNPEKIAHIQTDFLHYHQILKEDIEWTLTASEQIRNFFATGDFPVKKDYFPVPAKGHVSFIQQHILAGVTYRNCLDFEKSYQYRSALWNYFKKYPQLMELYPELYLTTVNMIIIGMNDLGKYEQSMNVLNELSRQTVKAQIAQIEVFRIQATYHTQTCNFMQKYDEAYLNTETATKNPFYKELHTIDKQLLHLHFAIACMGYMDHHKAIYYAYQVLNAGGNTNILTLSVFLICLAHLAQEDREAIDIIIQKYRNLSASECFYTAFIRILESGELKTASILKKLSAEYKKQDFRYRFSWEKYVDIEQLIKRIFPI